VEITEVWARSALPRREAGAHKWGVGGVVVVAGSPQYMGAAALCCLAAGRAGAGIVAAAVPRSIGSTVVGLAPDVTLIFLAEGESPSVARRAADAIEERLEQARAMVVGPGLGVDESTSALLDAIFGTTHERVSIGFGSSAGHTRDQSGLVDRLARPVVIDADGLNWLAKWPNWWEHLLAGQFVLTPHAGEMARLLDVDVADVVANSAQVAKDAAVKWRQTVVLKSLTTVIASSDGQTAEVAPPPALATAGSGDVLSGAIAAFLAQGLSPFDAGKLAAFVGARAAARVSSRYGTLGVLASDLPAAMAEELASLEGMGR
jgi:hydroxyethylthiazole kinase-like uncharacterized protein yjeF